LNAGLIKATSRGRIHRTVVEGQLAQASFHINRRWEYGSLGRKRD